MQINNMTSMSSPLKKAKNLGSAKSGLKHWWAIRFSAIALVPLSVWLVSALMCMANSSDAGIFKVLSSPINTILLIVFIIFALYHGALGMKEIYEDYIHKKSSRIMMIMITDLIAIITAVGFICAVLLFHFSVYNLV